ncbi:MAG: phage tail protein [Bryobacteraceae bacterium]
MATVFELKERAMAETPLLLFECGFGNGQTERWSTHRVEYGGEAYEARVIRHNLLEVQAASDQGVDGIPRISLALANADSHFSQLERTAGFKGARLTVRFVFFDARNGTAASDCVTLFQGVANPPEEITESVFRLSAINRMGMQRVLLPQVRIERRCPWEFPATAAQREEAKHGGERGRYSRFFRCGYSADRTEGLGNLNGGVPFAACGYTRQECELRGMFDRDAAQNITRRFGGVEFVPASILVRSYGERGVHASGALSNEARYNDFVPLVYGTAWYAPPVVFARNDGNLTRMELLLGMGEMQGVLKVVVNDVEIPQGGAGADMTATGWYNVVSLGNRTGCFNLDFEGGDPYGSMAYLSVATPNRISNGQELPRVKVLAEGLRLPVYGADGGYLRDEFTANPAWITLDILQRCGWTSAELDIGSFAGAAAYCDEVIQVRDLHGNTVSVPRFQCNLALERRRSAADVLRGVRNTARMLLTYGADGKLQARIENALAVQQPVKPEGSNAATSLNGGWPAYEFGDGANGTSGILRKENGEPAIRVWSRSTADTPNRLAVEFQDAFNEYQQDSYSLVDGDDAARAGQEISATVSALGIANFDQAARVLQLHLAKSVHGNTYVEFETSVKAFGVRPGDLIALTYLKEGFERQPFRVLKIAPGANYRTVAITAQIHRDEWYTDSTDAAGGGAGRGAGFGIGIPRPLSGNVTDANGDAQFSVSEQTVERADGGVAVMLSVGFTAPTGVEPGGPRIPLLSLAPAIGTGGTLAGDRVLYYAVSAVDGEGRESALSFTVRAAIPPGSNTNSVTLNGLSFAAGTAGFRVYRGSNPAQMFRIASDQPLAGSFTDTGLAAGLTPPPDANYDHANFYWRLELQPEQTATLHGANTVGNSALEMAENEYRGMVVRLLRGKGAGQERTVLENSATTLTLASDWSVEPDATSTFAVAETGWHFGAMAKSSPVEFEVPNRTGAVMQISGRSANVNDVEAPAELCTLTRWTVGGGTQGDADVPPAPMFGLGLSQRRNGTVELTGVSFSDLTNTRTVSSGTLALYYWNELSGAPLQQLASGVGAADTALVLNAAGAAGPGTLVQVEREIVRVVEVTDGGTRYVVERGADGSSAAEHGAGTAVYHLAKRVSIVPFAKGFFGSPASGRWSHAIALPNARVACAELFVTNGCGDSEATGASFTQNLDSGLRTLSGGQFSIQVDGFLAVDNAPAPELVVEADRSVRDVFAVVREAPVGGVVRARVTRNGETYCELTIAAGATISNVVDGFGLAPLASGTRLGLEVLEVGSIWPGVDLSVVVRL